MAWANLSARDPTAAAASDQVNSPPRLAVATHATPRIGCIAGPPKRSRPHLCVRPGCPDRLGGVRFAAATGLRRSARPPRTRLARPQPFRPSPVISPGRRPKRFHHARRRDRLSGDHGVDQALHHGRLASAWVAGRVEREPAGGACRGRLTSCGPGPSSWPARPCELSLPPRPPWPPPGGRSARGRASSSRSSTRL